MLSCSGCPVSAESCISYKILIYSDSESGIQYLSLKRSLLFMLQKYFNMKTLTLISTEKIHYSSHTMVVNLAKALSCSLALFHYFSMNSFVNRFNLIISLSFSWNFDPVVLLLSFWNSGFMISTSSGGLSVKISCWRD